MRLEPGGPIDDEMCQPARTENPVRDRGAPARVEDVTVEEEKSDTRVSHGAEQVIEPGGIEAVAEGIALGAAVGRRCSGDHRVDRVAAPSGNQRDKGAKGLPGQ